MADCAQPSLQWKWTVHPRHIITLCHRRWQQSATPAQEERRRGVRPDAHQTLALGVGHEMLPRVANIVIALVAGGQCVCHTEQVSGSTSSRRRALVWRRAAAALFRAMASESARALQRCPAEYSRPRRASWAPAAGCVHCFVRNRRLCARRRPFADALTCLSHATATTFCSQPSAVRVAAMHSVGGTSSKSAARACCLQRQSTTSNRHFYNCN